MRFWKYLVSLVPLLSVFEFGSIISISQASDFLGFKEKKSKQLLCFDWLVLVFWSMQSNYALCLVGDTALLLVSVYNVYKLTSGSTEVC